MELEEMESIWTQMSQELEKQKKLTHKMIIDMTNERYNNRLRVIAKYEGIGAVVCFGAALFIIYHFGLLNTGYLMFCGALSLLILLALPLAVLRAIWKMRQINIRSGTYRDNLLAFEKASNRFLFIQRLGLAFASVLMLVILPVMSKIIKGKDIFQDTQVWIWHLPLMGLFLLVFGWWGYSSYRRILRSAGETLRSMEG